VKSILVHIYDDVALPSRLGAAFDLARGFDAHLTCLHATPFEDYLATDPLVALELPEEFSTKMTRRREALQARVEERLRAEGMNWDWLHADELMSTALIRASALADLVVVTLAERAVMRDDPRPVAATVATGARTAVIGVPQGRAQFSFDAPAMIAWNGSPEAAAAMRAALPFLQRVPAVHLLEVEEKVPAYPRDRAARYLSRHGVHAEILCRARNGEVSEAIRRAAREVGAGLIVMGAYGHSRLREALLGGVTRDLVADSEIPLLLAH
jgi:nucleotide-binding universal stress UspA family protein